MCIILKKIERSFIMAKIYQIPPNTAEKEKAIGGVLTFAQFGWLVMGLVIALIIFVIFFMASGSKILGAIAGGPFLLVGTPFAFYKKYEMSLYKYLKLKKAFNGKTKQLINKK